MIGKTISHYKIIEKLGEGGMGEVYLAQDLKLKRKVSLKFLPQHLTKDKDNTERFEREAIAAAALNHPNIITIYEIAEENDQIFIVMEYIDGKSLRDVINESDLSIEKIVEIIGQLSEGLSKAHKAGIVHRDIKPENILIDQDERVKILDFGLAKLKGVSKLTKETSTLGTIHYMSPEQIQGKEVDQRSDIWSLGIVAYELIFGAPPFKGDYDQAVSYAILNEKLNLSKRTDIPLELRIIIERCLAKIREDRYQNIEEINENLNARKNKYGINAIRKIRSKKRLYLLLAGLFLIAVLVILTFLFNTPKAESKAPIPIAVVDFVNETGEEELNGLSGMLTTALEQSKRISVITRSRMFDILKQMDRENVDRIDEMLGKEIAGYAKINLLVLASIRKFDQMYNIDLKVLDTAEDKYVLTASVKDEGKGKIPSLIDELSVKTRQGLEENEEDFLAANRPIAELTSPNLEAYQHYFKGQEYIDKLMFEEAEKEFNEAIVLDSTFGLAYYQLAYTLDWEQNQAQAKAEIEKAYQYIEQIPDKEKYLVRFVKTVLDSGWGEAGLIILREMEKIYPDDKEMLYNIGDISWHIGEIDSAKKYLEMILKIDPYSRRAFQHLSLTYGSLKEYDQMLKTAKQYTALLKTEDAVFPLAEAHSLLESAYYGIGEYDKIEHEIDEQYKIYKRLFTGEEISNGMYWELCMFYTKRGLYKKAIKVLNKLIDSDSLKNTRAISQRGIEYFFIGEYEKAQVDFRRVLKIIPNDFYTLSFLSITLLAFKRDVEAEKIQIQIEKIYPARRNTAFDAIFYAWNGEKEKALAVDNLKSGDVHALLGLKEEAIRLLVEWSERHIKNKRSSYYELKTSRVYDNIRSDPRFQELLAKHKELYEENLRKYGDIDI